MKGSSVKVKCGEVMDGSMMDVYIVFHFFSYLFFIAYAS